jgi:protein TIF31
VNDFVELSEVKGLAAGGEMTLIEDPYTEKEARMHMIRIRDLIGAAGDRADTLYGISAGLSLHDTVCPPEMFDPHTQNGKGAKSASDAAHAMADYDFDAPASLHTVLQPPRDLAPKTVKSLCVSAWNPPPHHLRQKGHLLYLQLTTMEGEQFQITSHLSGFWVNKSSNSKFDPFPRPAPKSASAHSLLSLIGKVSPSFESTLKAWQEQNGRRDPLAIIQITNAIPSNPWLVPAAESSLTAHQPDPVRTQETYLMTGIENAEMLRDWNEEFQSTRELPRDSVQDRVFRERITSKLFADYTDAAVRGAVMVARGEVAPLNPTEARDAQIFVYNNVFFSYGADGVGTFTSEGGDEAARVAVEKDVAGVKLVNQLDIDGLFTPGTVVVDYLGKRLVGQSIVPGIFKQREPGEHQIDYGGVEGRDVVAESEAFVPTFSKLSKALRIKRHDVWDKEGKKHTLEGSVETKGLLGTDGRKYVLDLYRLTPLDITWLERYWVDGANGKDKPKETNYPHRMAVLRPELVEVYWRSKMTEYVKGEVEKMESKANGIKGGADGEKMLKEQAAGTGEEQAELADGQERVDLSDFHLAFNSDVYCGQVPQSEEEKEEWANDEKEVRAICKFLADVVIPELASYRACMFEFAMSNSTAGRRSAGRRSRLPHGWRVPCSSDA